jgi:hypothetical protein
MKAAKDVSLEEIDQHLDETVSERIEEIGERLKKLMAKSIGLPPKNGIATARKPDRKRLAVDIDHAIDVLAKQLRRQGIRDPIAQARNKVAEEGGFASGESLHRWLRRNR